MDSGGHIADGIRIRAFNIIMETIIKVFEAYGSHIISKRVICRCHGMATAVTLPIDHAGDYFGKAKPLGKTVAKWVIQFKPELVTQ